MSTYYRPTAKIPLNDIKKLKEFDVIFRNNYKLFFDGKNYLHFATDKDNNVIDVFRYGGNDDSFILEALENNFDALTITAFCLTFSGTESLLGVILFIIDTLIASLICSRFASSCVFSVALDIFFSKSF